MSIRLLTFDLDDTLWELGPVLQRAENVTWQWLAQHVPELISRESVESLRARRQQRMQEDPAAAHHITRLRLTTVTEALIDAGLDGQRAERIAIEALEVFLEARHQIELFDQAEAVLEALAGEYRLAAITNGNARLERLGLDHYFDFCIWGEEQRRAKPHADPFEAALARAGCRAAEAIHIGDHWEHDIDAAQRVGMHTVWVNRSGASWPGRKPPTAAITSVAELPQAVATIVTANGVSRWHSSD